MIYEFRLLALILIVSIASFSQAADFAPTRAGEVQGVLDAIEFDSSANFYVAGTFSGSLDFNPIAGVEDLKTSAGGTDIFVTRFNQNGSYAWTQTFGGTGDENLGDLKVSALGLYVCGRFNSSNAGIGAVGSIASAGLNDGFVFSLDLTTGSAQITFSTDGIEIFAGNANDTAESMFISGTSLYVTGNFNSSNFGLGAPAAVATSGGQDVFVAVLNATTGAAVTAFSTDGIQVLGGPGDEIATDVAFNNFRIYLTGSTESFGGLGIGGSGTAGSIGGKDFFIAAIDTSTGAGVTSFSGDGIQTFGGTADDFSYSMTISGGVIHVIGDMESSNAGFSGITGSFGGTKGLSHDWCVIAIDETTGAPLSGFGQAPGGFQQFGSLANDSSSDMVVIGSSIYLVGFYSGTDAAVGPSAGTLDSNFVRQSTVVSLSATAGSALPAFDTDGIAEPFRSIDSTAYHATTDGTNVVLGGKFFASGTSYVIRLDPTTGAILTTGAAPAGTNVSLGHPPYLHPTNGISIAVASNNGGTIQLAIGLEAFRRAPFSADTEFSDIPTRSSVALNTLTPSHTYTQAGIFVATVNVKDVPTNELVGKGRKTIAISRSETGEAALASAQPTSRDISIGSLKGKFRFSADKPDVVSFSGTFELPAGLDLSASSIPVSVGVGNITENITIDAKGKASGTGANGRLKKLKVRLPRLPKGTTVTVAGAQARLDLQYSLVGMVAGGFDTEGVSASRNSDEVELKKLPRKIQIALVIAGVSYEGLALVDLTLAKNGETAGIAGRRANAK